MQTTPFSILLTVLAITPPPSSLNPTIGSQTAIGGAGLIGYGEVADVVAMGIADGPAPVSATLPSGVIGIAYSATISVTGGTGPFTLSIVGSLPAGLSFNSTTGVISGTPTTAATSTFTVNVVDAAGLSGSGSFGITINAPSGGGGGNYGWVS
jgi:hypothetical protein